MRQKLNEELAERGTESLAKLFEGAFGVAEFMAASEVNVPGALGLTPDEWMERRISGPVRLSIEERRQLDTGDGPLADLPVREAAEVLGVSHTTVERDRNVAGTDVPTEPMGSIPEAQETDTAGTSVPDGPADEPMPRSMDVHYSSETDEWSTPQDFFDVLHAEFEFDLDVCALDSSAKCERYFTPETDGLAQEWTGTCWMNPPYGESIGKWVAKADESAKAGATVVCLLPARVDTGWWWDHCRHAEIRFLRGRLRFGEATSGAPFPSAVVVFGRPAVVKWWER